MKELEKLMNIVKDMIDKTSEDIRNGEPYLKDQVLHQFYEGRIPSLRKKKQDFMRILRELEKIAQKLADSEDLYDEENEEDNLTEMSEM